MLSFTCKLISPEAPIPVFREKGKERLTPGGAANVAMNLAAIGIDTSICGVVGRDENAKKLKDLMTKQSINTDLLVEDDNRVTTRKLRYIGPNNQQMLRVDSEDDSELSTAIQSKLFEKLTKELDTFDLVLISDYAKGLLSEDFTQRLIGLAGEKNIPVFADVKGKNPSKYSSAMLIKPNRKELNELTGMPVGTLDESVSAAVALCKKVGCRYVLATLGADGMLLVDQNHLVKNIQSVASEVFDVTGAGDTSVAYLAAEYAKGRTIESAMVIANIAAGIQVSRTGTSIVAPHDVRDALKAIRKGEAEVDKSDRNLFDRIKEHHLNGEKIVFTNGCFDILHVGHVSYLRKAKELGDVLVVGVNDDFSVKRLKGNERPVNCLEDRLQMLEALQFVDYVLPFGEDTPIELIKKVIPDVLVKGGDYKIDDIVGADFVRDNGGEVMVLPFVDGKSTTDTITKIKRMAQ